MCTSRCVFWYFLTKQLKALTSGFTSRFIDGVTPDWTRKIFPFLHRPSALLVFISKRVHFPCTSSADVLSSLCPLVRISSSLESSLLFCPEAFRTSSSSLDSFYSWGVSSLGSIGSMFHIDSNALFAAALRMIDVYIGKRQLITLLQSRACASSSQCNCLQPISLSCEKLSSTGVWILGIGRCALGKYELQKAMVSETTTFRKLW